MNQAHSAAHHGTPGAALPATLAGVDTRPAGELLALSPVAVAFGAAAAANLGQLIMRPGGPELPVRDGARVLVVVDPAVEAAGHLAPLLESLTAAGLRATCFDDVRPNPTTETVAAALHAARSARPELIVGMGGGSAMDCAKAVNLLLSCGGEVADYRGDPPPETLAGRPPLLPMILVPTTAGTGSEAQSFALISDARTHAKMACGDRRPPGVGLRPAWAVLDPRLTRTAPPSVTAAAGLDAVSHAVESAGSTARNDLSQRCSRAAWELVSAGVERVCRDIGDDEARAALLLGAHLAGAAIENAMLGGAHACANPLTARFDVVHGLAVGLMLPHVVRINTADGADPYAGLGSGSLPELLERFLATARAPTRLRDVGVPRAALPELAAMAAGQWTAGFNPRPFGRDEALRVYEAAW